MYFTCLYEPTDLIPKQIKTLAPIRASDRRRLADQLIRTYRVPAPEAEKQAGQLQGKQEESEKQGDQQQSGVTGTDNSATIAPTLSSIRDRLVPAGTRSGRFTTTVGANATNVSGTLWVGTFSDKEVSEQEREGEERVLWFRIEQGASALHTIDAIQQGVGAPIYPTVYTLWANPGLVPLLHTPENVLPRLAAGADLMIPGLAHGPPFPAGATRSAVVGVAGEDGDVPVWVGVCELDVSSLGKVQGMKGRAAVGIQWVGDELWSWAADGSGGGKVPDRINGWGENSIKEEGVVETGDEENGKDGVEFGGGDEEEKGEEEGETEEEVTEPTTAEIDKAFESAFFYSLYKHKNSGQPPQYGLPFPIQLSFVISNMITPLLPIRSPRHAQAYQIKRTSWKTPKKFLKNLERQRVLRTKERNGGETVITEVDFGCSQLANFVPYRLEKPKPKEKSTNKGDREETKATNTFASDAPLLTVRTYYRPAGKLTPTLFPPRAARDRRNYYTVRAVTVCFNSYLTAHNLIDSTNPRLVRLDLDSFLATSVLDPKRAPPDAAAVARGRIQRDVLLRRLLSDPSLCTPYHVILMPEILASSAADEEENEEEEVSDPSLAPPPATAKLHPGTGPKVTISIEKRTGTKVVTRIAGLGAFGILSGKIAEELRQACASSTTVIPAGQNQGQIAGEEVQVQGDHTKTIQAALAKRGVKGNWVEVVDRTKKKK